MLFTLWFKTCDGCLWWDTQMMNGLNCDLDRMTRDLIRDALAGVYNGTWKPLGQRERSRLWLHIWGLLFVTHYWLKHSRIPSKYMLRFRRCWLGMDRTALSLIEETWYNDGITMQSLIVLFMRSVQVRTLNRHTFTLLSKFRLWVKYLEG